MATKKDTDENSELSNQTVHRIDPESETFAKALPHLVPGVLRRRLTIAQIKERAFSEMWNMAKLALNYFNDYDPQGVEAMVGVFVKRVFERDLLSKYDPERGEIEKYLYVVMRNIARECLRARSRQRAVARLDESLLSSREPAPSIIPERNDQIECVRKWVVQLPPAQRNAVARRFAVLADLDFGGAIPNERVALHRGLKRLRRRAMESDMGDSSR